MTAPNTRRVGNPRVRSPREQRAEAEILFIAHCAVEDQPTAAARSIRVLARAARIHCSGCSRLFPTLSLDASTGCCPGCYEAAGLENEHSDGYHRDQPNPDCLDCRAANVDRFGDGDPASAGGLGCERCPDSIWASVDSLTDHEARVHSEARS